MPEREDGSASVSSGLRTGAERSSPPGGLEPPSSSGSRSWYTLVGSGATCSCRMKVRMSQRSYEVPDAATVLAPSRTVRSQFSTANTVRHHCEHGPMFARVSLKRDSDCGVAAALGATIPAVPASDGLCSASREGSTAPNGIITNPPRAASGYWTPRLGMQAIRPPGHTDGLFQKSQVNKIRTIPVRCQPIRYALVSRWRPNRVSRLEVLAALVFLDDLLRTVADRHPTNKALRILESETMFSHISRTLWRRLARSIVDLDQSIGHYSISNLNLNEGGHTDEFSDHSS